MILRRAARYIPFLLVCGIIAGGVTYVIARSRVTYTASSTIAVSPVGDSAQVALGSSSAGSSQTAVNVEAEVPFVESQSVGQAADARVRAQLHRPAGAYSATSDATAETLTVTATSSHRAVAAATANAVLQSFEQSSSRSQTGALKSGISKLESQLASYKNALRPLNKAKGPLAQAQRSAIETRYQAVATQVENLQALNGVSQAEFSTISSATPAAAQPSATKKLGLLGLVLGLVLAAILAFARELALGYVKSGNDVALATPELALLARLPSLKQKYREGIVGTGDQPAVRSFDEALRRVRVNLGLLHPLPPPRTLLVASADPREGRTLVAINLAAGWARTGRRVLLVASDLRHSDMVALLKAPQPGSGLTDLLSRPHGIDETMSFAEVDQAVTETAYPNLSLLPSGTITTDPVDLLEKDRLTEIIDLVSHHWDVVVFDSAPLLRFGDAALLASKVDAVILIATVGRTRARRLRAAAGSLRSVGVRDIFTVTNRETGDLAPPLPPASERPASDLVEPAYSTSQD